MTTATSSFVVKKLAVMVSMGGSDGSTPSVNIKQDERRVKFMPPGRYKFVFRRPTVVFIEYFLSCGNTQARIRRTLKEIVVVLTDDGVLSIQTDRGEKITCWGAPGVLVESEEPEAEVAEA